MNNKQIEKLAQISYSNNELDGDRVARIMQHLSRGELREYLRQLRRIEAKLTVYIDSNADLDAQSKKKFEALYPKKKVVFRVDPSLLFGVRITEGDMIYNLNMKSSLENIKMYLKN